MFAGSLRGFFRLCSDRFSLLRPWVVFLGGCGPGAVSRCSPGCWGFLGSSCRKILARHGQRVPGNQLPCPWDRDPPVSLSQDETRCLSPFRSDEWGSWCLTSCGSAIPSPLDLDAIVCFWRGFVSWCLPPSLRDLGKMLFHGSADNWCGFAVFSLWRREGKKGCCLRKAGSQVFWCIPAAG